MHWVSFIAGLGVSLSIAFMMLPEITGYGNQEPKVTSRSQPSPTPVANRSEEEISASKNYQPPDHWKWKYESERNVICEPLWDMPWQVVCHTNFERPIAREQPRVRRREQPRYGGCPQRGCPQPAPQDDPEEPVTIQSPSPGYTVARMEPRYEYGPPIFGSDGRWHRTRRQVR